jgi:homoserine kinase type II
MPTAEVVRNVDGHRISVIDGRLILVKRWIEGKVIEPLPAHLLPAAGALLARLHQIPLSSVPDLPAGTRRLSPEQQALISEFPDRGFAEWLTAGLAEVSLREAALPPRAAVISHGDVFADNVIVRPDDQLAIERMFDILPSEASGDLRGLGDQ